jgi:hypothetical protein
MPTPSSLHATVEHVGANAGSTGSAGGPVEFE